MPRGEILYLNEKLYNDSFLKLEVGELFQLSELSIVRGSDIESHTQICDEITFAISGKAIFESDDKKDEVSKGQIHYIKKGSKHKILADKDSDFRYICIGINPDTWCENIKSFTSLNLPSYFIINDNGSIRELSQLLMGEISFDEETSHIMIDAYLTQIFIILSRLIKETYKGDFSKNFKKNQSSHTFYKILKFIDREYININSVDDISKKLSYNKFYISHIVKENLNISVKEYITHKKIAHSLEMLKTTDISIEQISDYLSFNAPHTFRQAFKRITGESPTQYRNRVNSKK